MPSIEKIFIVDESYEWIDESEKSIETTLTFNSTLYTRPADIGDVNLTLDLCLIRRMLFSCLIFALCLSLTFMCAHTHIHIHTQSARLLQSYQGRMYKGKVRVKE